MKRRTYRRIRAEQQPEHHHSVYVVLLDPAAGRLRSVRAANLKRDRKQPCVYVVLSERLDKEPGSLLNWSRSGVPALDPCAETYEAKTT